MNESYAETAVKKLKSAKTILAKGGLIFLDVLLLAGGFLFGQSIVMFLGLAACIVTVYCFPLFNVDYEYIFCDGQFDFDKILGGNKRKNMLKVDLENSEVLCPATSHQLDSYTYQKVELKDYSSGNPEAKVYALVGKDNKENRMVKVLFEPNEKMIALAKQKAPRKVFLD